MNEVLPEPDIIKQLVAGILRPTIETVAKDAARHIELTPVIVHRGTEQQTLDVIHAGNGEVLHGKARLRFRVAPSGRVVMDCETLFVKEEAVKKCSGFSLKGELRPGDAAKRTEWTMRYSVWDWMGWE